MMKKDAVLINAARGPVIDEKALVAFLQANKEFRFCAIHSSKNFKGCCAKLGAPGDGILSSPHLNKTLRARRVKGCCAKLGGRVTACCRAHQLAAAGAEMVQGALIPWGVSQQACHCCRSTSWPRSLSAVPSDGVLPRNPVSICNRGQPLDSTQTHTLTRGALTLRRLMQVWAGRI